jgi:hypothetical protein
MPVANRFPPRPAVTQGLERLCPFLETTSERGEAFRLGAPIRRHAEFRVCQHRQIGSDLSGRKVSLEFDGEANEGIFLAVVDPC